MTYIAIKLQCSCGSRDPFDHPTVCELWNDEMFRDGYFAWDADAGELVDIDTMDDDALEALFDDPGEIEAPPLDELKCRCASPKDYCCAICKVIRDNPSQAWRPYDPSKELAPTTTPKSTAKATSSGGMGWQVDDWGWSKCRHYFQPVLMPSGDTIYCSSSMSANQRSENERPNFGIYFYSGVTPVTLAFYINWPDHNIPTIPINDVVHAAREGLRLAKEGSKVEIGCFGGHGRTGTFLAVMALLQGVPGPEAKDWVHDNYCEFAIEGKQQEWYILAVDAHLRGVEAPPRPIEPVYTNNTWVSRSFKIDGVTHWWEKEWEPKKNYVCHDIVSFADKIWVALTKPITGGEPGEDDGWHEADKKVIEAVDDWKAEQDKVDAKRKEDEAKKTSPSPTDEKKEKKEKRHHLVWRAAWQRDATYDPGDVVSYLGEFYICRKFIFKAFTTPFQAGGLWKLAEKGVVSKAYDPAVVPPDDDKKGLDKVATEEYDTFVEKLKRRQRRDSNKGEEVKA